MGWINIEDKYPPEGLEVLVEASGYYSSCGVVADHDFFIGSWLWPEGQDIGEWIIYDKNNSDVGMDHGHIYNPTVHAWMPLPRHFAGKEMGFSQEPDLMEHAMFEDDPDYLYKGDAVYEQMSLEEWLGGANG